MATSRKQQALTPISNPPFLLFAYATETKTVNKKE